MALLFDQLCLTPVTSMKRKNAKLPEQRNCLPIRPIEIGQQYLWGLGTSDDGKALKMRALRAHSQLFNLGTARM